MSKDPRKQSSQVTGALGRGRSRHKGPKERVSLAGLRSHRSIRDGWTEGRTAGRENGEVMDHINIVRFGLP